MRPLSQRFTSTAAVRLGVTALLIALALASVLTSAGCAPRTPPSPTPAPPASAAELEQALAGIRETAARRMSAVNSRNKEAFLATVDAQNPVYLVEQRHWFEDAVQTVKDYSLTINGLELTSRDQARVKASQTIALANGETRRLDFTAAYQLQNGTWLDSDYLFEDLRQDRVLVRHWNRPKAGAATLAAEAENVAWLGQTFGWTPSADIVIKLYPERSAMILSIKPSLPDWVAGWTESGESIKYLVPEDKSASSAGLLHETTHQMLSQMTNDNAAYWFQEGLATWSPRARAGDFQVRKTRAVIGKDAPRWTQQELESINLEKLEDGVPIYYAQSFLTVKYIIDVYGLDKVKAIAAELARQPANPATASEKLEEANQRTRAAIEKALGIPFDQFAAQSQDWMIDQLRAAR